MRDKLVAILERIVVVAIILVLVQSFLEDLSQLLDWSWTTRRAILIGAFAFDLFFTIEFLTRFYFAFIAGRAGRYIFKERGWIDFIASIPLLLFSSGPLMIAIATGGAPLVGVGRVLNLLKVIKAIRIARILRLMRALKIFQYIKHADSAMAQRHVSRITTLAVSIFVFVVFAASMVDVFVDLPGLDSDFRDGALGVARFVEEEGLAAEDNRASLARFAEHDGAILLVRDGAQTRYSRYSDEFYREYFGPADYTYVTSDDVGVFVDLRPLNRAQARESLLYFLLIVATIAGFLFIYGPHFAVTVSDPIHVMERGMNEHGYNLQVRIPEKLEGDEVFRLASAYNHYFLPMKDRSEAGESAMSDLKMDDLSDLLDDREHEESE